VDEKEAERTVESGPAVAEKSAEPTPAVEPKEEKSTGLGVTVDLDEEKPVESGPVAQPEEEEPAKSGEEVDAEKADDFGPEHEPEDKLAQGDQKAAPAAELASDRRCRSSSEEEHFPDSSSDSDHASVASNPLGEAVPTDESGEPLMGIQLLARLKANKGTLPLMETPLRPPPAA
jgi:hypothetical protein